MLVALGRGMELVVSHRSKSPNDDMEAQIALAVNALGLKAGGGANTEATGEYQAVTEFMHRGVDVERQGDPGRPAPRSAADVCLRRANKRRHPLRWELPWSSASPDAGVALKFRGATPLGTSAGTGEAIHLVDSVIEKAEYREVVERNLGLFRRPSRGSLFSRKKRGKAKYARAKTRNYWPFGTALSDTRSRVV